MNKISVNRVTLIGNVSEDPDYRMTPNGTPVTSAILVTTDSWTDRNDQPRERRHWHRLVFWRASAQTAKDELVEGTQLYIEGRLQTRSWDDRSGTKREVTEVVVMDFSVLDHLATEAVDARST